MTYAPAPTPVPTSGPPIAMAGLLLIVSSGIVLVGSALFMVLPGVAAYAFALNIVMQALSTAGLVAAAIVLVAALRRHGTGGKNLAVVALIVFAAAVALGPILSWAAQFGSAQGPTPFLYIAGSITSALSLISWVAGILAVFALFRAGVLARAGMLAGVIGFAVLGLMGLGMTIFSSALLSQGLIIVAWTVRGIVTPLVVIAIGAVWIAEARRGAGSR